jgi:SAM-dependent methyltransferase
VDSSSPHEGIAVAEENEEATAAWSGVLFDRFVAYRDLIVEGLGSHGEAAMEAYPPDPGTRVLDVGCGFGDTTQRLAGLVGPQGEAVGVDVSQPFIAAAKEEAEAAAVGNVSFMAGDVQQMDLGGPYDYAFSRMGIMFFANPVAAMGNVRRALVGGGRFVGVVWRRKLDNPWMHRAEEVADRYLEEPEETDEPTCGPGPFSMANADTVSGQFQAAGFEEVSLRRCDLPIRIGNDLDHAVEFNMALGPAAELIRLAGDEAEKILPKLKTEIREALADFDEGPGGVSAPASTWIVTAVAPAAG